MAQTDFKNFEHSSLWSKNMNFGETNAAFMFSEYSSDICEIHAGHNLTSYKKAEIQEEGTGEWRWEMKVKSYSSIKQKNKIWGEANYSSGKKRNVIWNSTADFRLLYPYVLADTVGGDLDCERYHFSGGCATQLGKFIIGERVTFRADHEYRDVDPRPRSVVTDLFLEVGGLYHLGLFDIGIDGGALIYKQTNDVSFYQELGKTPELQMTGIGSDYKRFSGSNASAYYKSIGYTVGTQLLPKDSHSGVFINVNYTDRPFQRILTSLNSLPISRLYLMECNAEFGWKKTKEKTNWTISGSWHREKRHGDEIIAGSSASSEYKKLGELTMFHAKLDEYTIRAALRQKQKSIYTFKIDGGIQKYSSDYVFPNRVLAFDKVYGKVVGQWQRAFQHIALELDGNVCYYSNIYKKLTYPQALVSPTNLEYLNNLYESASADYLLAGMGSRITFLMEKTNLFCCLTGGYLSATNNNGFSINTRIGINF